MRRRIDFGGDRFVLRAGSSGLGGTPSAICRSTIRRSRAGMPASPEKHHLSLFTASAPQYKQEEHQRRHCRHHHACGASLDARHAA